MSKITYRLDRHDIEMMLAKHLAEEYGVFDVESVRFDIQNIGQYGRSTVATLVGIDVICKANKSEKQVHSSDNGPYAPGTK